MVKSELVRALNEKLPELQVKDVELALNCILGQMASAIVQGERIEIRGFGSFNLHHRPPRIARNPKTGEAINLGLINQKNGLSRHLYGTLDITGLQPKYRFQNHRSVF